MESAEDLIARLPAMIDSKEHSGKKACLTMRKEEGIYFAWYIVTGENCSDYGASGKTIQEALRKLSEKIKEPEVIDDDDRPGYLMDFVHAWVKEHDLVTVADFGEAFQIDSFEEDVREFAERVLNIAGALKGE